MRSTAFYITFVLVTASMLFVALIAESLGLFDRRQPPASRPLPFRVEARGPTETLPAREGFARDKKGEVAGAPRLAARGPTVLKGGQEAGSQHDLEAELRALRSENRDLRDRLVAVLNWVLANFRGRYPLPEDLMVRLNIPAVTGDFLLHPEAARFLSITAEEEQKINDALVYARQYLAEVEAAIIQVTNPRSDKVILHIPTFEEDGEALRSDLYAALEITLGSRRFNRFLQASGGELEDSFSRFGKAARTMVFELVYSQPGEAPRLKIKDGWVWELEPGVKQVTATESTVTNLPTRYANYLAWLPGYVAAYAR